MLLKPADGLYLPTLIGDSIKVNYFTYMYSMLLIDMKLCHIKKHFYGWRKNWKSYAQDIQEGLHVHEQAVLSFP